MGVVGTIVYSDKFGKGMVVDYSPEKRIDNLTVKFERYDRMTVNYSYPKCIDSYLQIINIDKDTSEYTNCLYDENVPHIEMVRKENIVPSTCRIEGHCDKVIYCILCKKEISRERLYSPKKPHIKGRTIKENVVESCCTAEGYFDYNTYCKSCGVLLNSSRVIIEKKQHQCDRTIIDYEPPKSKTIISRKKITYYCTVCGRKVSQSYFDTHKNTKHSCKANDYLFGYLFGFEHDPSSFPDIKKHYNPTCQENGYCEEVYRCNNCRKILLYVYETTFPSYHDYVQIVENKIDSTCFTDGSYEILTKCRYCGKIKKRESKIIPQKKHESEYVEEILYEPTYSQNGKFDIVCRCSNCKKELKRFHYIIPKLSCPQPLNECCSYDKISDEEIYYENYDCLSDYEKVLFDSLSYNGLRSEQIIKLPIYYKMRKLGFEYYKGDFVFIGMN